MAEWNFHYTTTTWSYQNGILDQSSGDYKGTITYDKKDKNKATLLINFMDGRTTTFEMDEDKNISCCGGQGRISKKAISFSISSSACNYGLGGGVGYTVEGTKVK